MFLFLLFALFLLDTEGQRERHVCTTKLLYLSAMLPSRSALTEDERQTQQRSLLSSLYLKGLRSECQHAFLKTWPQPTRR